jgi:UPF0755 protein
MSPPSSSTGWQGHAAAVRSDDHLRDLRRRRQAGRPADLPVGPEEGNALQHLCDQGLPPTPIANPGRDALEAVANPWKTQDLYFVADGTGGHVFAATLEEHNANVKRWRKLEADKGADPNIAVDGQPDGAAPAEAPAAPPQKKKKTN